MARGGGGGRCWPPMDLMRSEAMQLVQVIIPTESAHLTISYLGDLGLLQFKDLNADQSPFQRTYAAQIKRCGEMARKLRFFKEQMSTAGISTSPTQLTENPLGFDDLEIKLGELEAELTEVNANNEKLQRTYNELLEYSTVLQKELRPHILRRVIKDVEKNCVCSSSSCSCLHVSPTETAKEIKKLIRPAPWPLHEEFICRFGSKQ